MNIQKITNHDMNLDVEGQNSCYGCKVIAKTRFDKPTPGYECEEVVTSGWHFGDAF